MSPVLSMSLHGASRLRTICEVLREVYELYPGRDARSKMTRKKLVEAERMAKKMTLKLIENKLDIDWNNNQDWERDLLRRMDADMKKRYQTIKARKKRAQEKKKAKAKKKKR